MNYLHHFHTSYNLTGVKRLVLSIAFYPMAGTTDHLGMGVARVSKHDQPVRAKGRAIAQGRAQKVTETIACTDSARIVTKDQARDIVLALRESECTGWENDSDAADELDYIVSTFFDEVAQNRSEA